MRDEHGVALPEQGGRWVQMDNNIYFMSAQGFIKWDGKEFTNLSEPLDNALSNS